jgi:hypothetical protein
VPYRLQGTNLNVAGTFAVRLGYAFKSPLDAGVTRGSGSGAFCRHLWQEWATLTCGLPGEGQCCLLLVEETVGRREELLAQAAHYADVQHEPTETRQEIRACGGMDCQPVRSTWIIRRGACSRMKQYNESASIGPQPRAPLALPARRCNSRLDSVIASSGGQISRSHRGW